MKITIYSLLFLLLFNPTFAQNIESLTVVELDSIFNVLCDNEQYEKALQYAHESAKKTKLAGVETNYANSLYNLAYIYTELGNYERAEGYFLQTVEIEKRTLGEDNPNYAISLNELAALYMNLGKFELAETLFLKAQKIRKKNFGEEHFQYSNSLKNLAILYQELSRYEAAEILFLQALEIDKKILGETSSEYSISLINLATLYSVTGKLEASEKLFLQSIEINKKNFGEDNIQNAAAINNLAVLYKRMEEYETAETLYLQAQKIWKKAFGEYHPEYASTLNNLASLYKSMGRFSDAEKLYLQAQKIYKITFGEESPDYSTHLNNLAVLYQSMGNSQAAKSLFLQSKNLIEKHFGKNHEQYFNILNNLSSTYLHLDNPEPSKSYLFEAILSNCKDNTLDTISLDNNLAILTQKEFRSTILLIETLSLLFNHYKYLYLQSNNTSLLEKGYEALEIAMQINEKSRLGLSSEEDKLRSLKKMSSLTTNALQLGLVLSKKTTINYTEKAFSYAEQNKSILLADAVKGQKAHTLGDLPDSLAFFETKLQDRKKQLEKAETEANDPETKNAIQIQQNALNLEIDVFLKSIKGKYPKYHALKYANITANVKDVQALINDETLFLEYVVSDSAVYLFAITNQTLTLIPITLDKVRLTKKVKDLRQSLSNYKLIFKNSADAYQSYTLAAFWFYDNLVAPALKAAPKNIKNLIIVTDGELGHLPFEAFLTAEAPQTETSYKDLDYLVKDYNISYNYSATLLVEAHKNLNVTKKALTNGKLLGFAADYNLKSDSLRATHLQKIRSELINLPAAQEEIQEISKIFNGDYRQGKEANETYFKNHAHDYSIIHLAMHGILNQKAPILSSFAFSEDNDSIQDNFLEAWEIAHLKLNAELVVLSACETGYGIFQQGEGVMSLARSFMYAGVPSLVVSLWQVNDHSTAQIMHLFYSNLSKGFAKDVALRQAKLDYLEKNDGQALHPAFWSAFIQLGDNRPILLAKKGNTRGWIIGASIALVILLLGVLFRTRNLRVKT